jgi:hypothetical protein
MVVMSLNEERNPFTVVLSGMKGGRSITFGMRKDVCVLFSESGVTRHTRRLVLWYSLFSKTSVFSVILSRKKKGDVYKKKKEQERKK